MIQFFPNIEFILRANCETSFMIRIFFDVITRYILKIFIFQSESNFRGFFLATQIRQNNISNNNSSVISGQAIDEQHIPSSP